MNTKVLSAQEMTKEADMQQETLLGRLLKKFQRRSRVLTHRVLTYEDIVQQIVKSQSCHCNGGCPHCSHIIKDVIGR